MKFFRSSDFTGTRAWDALNIANIEGVTVRLHWANEPYHWHVNDGEEVFAVISGKIDMHFRRNKLERIIKLKAGDIFFAEIGCEHVAYPRGEARVLVVEKAGSE